MWRALIVLMLGFGSPAAAEEPATPLEKTPLEKTPLEETLREKTPAEETHGVQATCSPETCAHCKARSERLLTTVSRVALLPPAKLRAEVKPGQDALEKIYGDIYFNPYVAKCMYGLALLASGTATEAGERKKALDACVLYATKELTNESKGFNATYNMYPWELAFGVLFLTEVQDRKPTAILRAALSRAAEHIRRSRLPNGGWEKFSSTNPNYELLVTTNGMAAALGRLSDCGIEIPKSFRSRILDYYQACAFDDGGSAYSLKTKGNGAHVTYEHAEAGRTAGALLALMTLRASETSAFKKARTYLTGRVAEINTSHGSLQLHRLFGGLACFRLGGTWWTAYREKVLSPTTFPRENYNFADCGVPYFGDAVDIILLHASARRLSILKTPSK